MALLLTMVLAASPPDPALLEKLGAHARRLEDLTNASAVTVDIKAEELDGDGAVKKTTRTTMRVARTKGHVERKLLLQDEDGKDLTEAKRAELEAVPKKEGAAVRSPFHPDEQAKYRFVMLAPPERQPALVRLGFQPAGEKNEALSIGDATVDPEAGEVRTLSLRPSKNPAFVDALFIELTLDAVTPAGHATSRLALRGSAGVLFFKKRFRVVTTFADYEPR